MGKFALEIKASLSNVVDVHSEPEIDWSIQFKCCQCGEITEHFHNVNQEKTMVATKTAGEANFRFKCSFCKRGNSISVVDKSVKPYTMDENESFSPVVVFDCRGIEPVMFKFDEGWTVKSSSGALFDANLADNDWAEYDEKIKQTVEVFDLDYRFIKVK